MTHTAPVSELMSLGSIVMALPSGACFDLSSREPLATVPCSSAGVLVRTQGRTLVVNAELRELQAHDTRTGELVWSQSTPWVSDLTVVESNGAAVLCMQEVKKWGGGSWLARDAATGRLLERAELSAALASVDARRTIVGSAREPAAFASSDGETVLVHRARDGAVVARFSAHAAPSDATTTTEDGARVTTFTVSFAGPRWRAFFGAREVLVVTPEGFSLVDVESATTRRVATEAIPPATTVIDAHCDGDQWWLLARATDGAVTRVDVMQIERDEARVRWSDCAAVALVGARVIDAALRVGAITDGAYSGSLTDAADDPWTAPPIERSARVIPMDRALLGSLARVRYLSREKAPPGLGAAAVSELERELGRVLPNWALGLLAANSSALNKKLGITFDALIERNAELAALEREMLEKPKEASWMSDPTPFRPGIIALGRTARRERRSEPHWLRKIPCRFDVTTWWCAGAKGLVVVERWQREENSYLPASTSIHELAYGAPTLTSLLAELIASLRPKHDKSLRAAGITDADAREQEDRAVAALSELRLQ